MKKAIIEVIGVMVAITLVVIILSNNKNKFEYYDLNNNFGTSSKCKISDHDELICKKGKEWIKVNQYSLVPNK